MTHALAKGIMVHLGLDSAREGCACVYKCTSNKYKTEKLKQDFKTSQLILRVDHVSSKRKKRH